MPQSSDHDHYHVSGNVEAQFMDEAQTVLKNKKGITNARELQRAEEESLGRAYGRLITEARMDALLDCSLIRMFHTWIFGELYEWAGRWRTVWISKPGTTWPSPEVIDGEMIRFERDVLDRVHLGRHHDDFDFCQKAAIIQGEFLVIHPFREGNARTIKMLTNLLALQTGRPPLAYDDSDAGRRRYIRAAKAAFGMDYDPLERIIMLALARAREG